MAKKNKKKKPKSSLMVALNQKQPASVRVKNKPEEVQIRYGELRERVFKRNMSMFGSMLGLASKQILKEMGHDVDFKINGEDISTLKYLAPPDLEERIKRAISEERYEDAAKLRDLIKKLSNGK